MTERRPFQQGGQYVWSMKLFYAARAQVWCFRVFFSLTWRTTLLCTYHSVIELLLMVMNKALFKQTQLKSLCFIAVLDWELIWPQMVSCFAGVPWQDWWCSAFFDVCLMGLRLLSDVSPRYWASVLTGTTPFFGWRLILPVSWEWF